MSSTAALKVASFALDGLLKPVIFLTYCSEAARTSSSGAGGSQLKMVFILLHTGHGHQTGRTRLELPGDERTVAGAIADLRSQGLFVEVIK